GQVLEELAGNGIRTVSSYDLANGHLLTLANQAPNGQFLQKLSYCYDPAGNIINITDAALPIQYSANQRIEPVRHLTYDTLYQLIKATGWESARPSLGPALPAWQDFGSADSSRWCNYTETYFYDAAGNLLQRVHQGAVNDTLTMQVAAHSNRSIKGRPGAELDGLFDARGNLLELQPGQSLQWNGRNELTEVVQVARSDAPGDREFYRYDHEGKRVRKCRTAAAKSIIHSDEVRYLPGLELHSNSATGENLQVVSVQAGRCSVRLLHWDSPAPGGVENDQLRYCFDDHLGSSAIEVDAEAKPISQEIYYPFGGTAWLAGRNKVETSYKTIRYSGKERDATGLYYYGARYYAPWLQRWLNPDPAGNVDGINFYRFVRDNPAVYFDEQGNFPLLSRYLDYRLEKKFKINHLVQHRGLNKIRMSRPQFADFLVQSLSVARQAVKNAANKLGERSYDQQKYEAYFGSVKSEEVLALTNRYREMELLFEKLLKKPSKIVAFYASEGENGYAEAFVLGGDRRRKIYINLMYSNMAVSELARVLVHEVSHQLKNKTDDYYYIHPDRQELEDAALTIDSRRKEKVLPVAMGTRSRTMLTGNASADHLEHTEPEFLEVTNSIDVRTALNVYNSDPKLRRKIARNNADSLAGFAMSS
ncbi:RHS repeat-associated core domain-containing protein, partial [Pseudomonas sp. Ant30-3]|uniref:RHS repeat-associated core domain-containing protein n=1 Tax=Pseudomonas sp. Ant30-3 TaxID=1488328 RepID=UPI000519B62A